MDQGWSREDYAEAYSNAREAGRKLQLENAQLKEELETAHEETGDEHTMNEYERRMLASTTVMGRLLMEIRNNTRSAPLKPVVFESATVPFEYADTPQLHRHMAELRRAMQWLVNVGGVWRGDGKNRPELPRWASAPSGLHRHPGEDATYDELEARLNMFARIGLQLYRALQTNCAIRDGSNAGITARQRRIDALNAWEQKFKDK